MPISHNASNGLSEVRYRNDERLLMLLPTQIFVDLRDKAHESGIDRASDERYLLGEVSYASHRIAEPKCWNCGDSLGFYAPTGKGNRGLWYVRSDGNTSQLKYELQLYPCPACQNPKRKLIEDLRRAGIADPEAAITKEIYWNSMEGRFDMELGIRELIQRIKHDTYAGQVTLVGPYGCGKSTLAQYVVVEARKANRDALYITADAFKEAVSEQIHTEADGGGSAYLKRIKSAPIVVMDQIDWIRETVSGGRQSYTAEIFRDVFNHRYELRRTHCTLYVVNLQAWQKRGDEALAAIYDRMTDGIVLIADIHDIRQTLNQSE